MTKKQVEFLIEVRNCFVMYNIIMKLLKWVCNVWDQPEIIKALLEFLYYVIVICFVMYTIIMELLKWVFNIWNQPEIIKALLEFLYYIHCYMFCYVYCNHGITKVGL